MTLALQPTSIEQGVLTRADGSVRYSTRTVTVLASVNGPLEVPLRKELLNSATLQIEVLPLRGVPTPHSKLIARNLHTVLASLVLLHLHPKSLVQITLQTTALPSLRFSKPFQSTNQQDTGDVLESSSAVELASLLNASILALLDSAVPLKATATASALALSAAGQLILDPTIEQERDASQCFVVAFAFAKTLKDGAELVWLETTKGGVVTDEQLDQVLDVGKKACEQTLAFFRSSIETKYASLVDAVDGTKGEESEECVPAAVGSFNRVDASSEVHDSAGRPAYSSRAANVEWAAIVTAAKTAAKIDGAPPPPME